MHQCFPLSEFVEPSSLPTTLVKDKKRQEDIFQVL